MTRTMDPTLTFLTQASRHCSYDEVAFRTCPDGLFWYVCLTSKIGCILLQLASGKPFLCCSESETMVPIVANFLCIPHLPLPRKPCRASPVNFSQRSHHGLRTWNTLLRTLAPSMEQLEAPAYRDDFSLASKGSQGSRHCRDLKKWTSRCHN